MPKFTENILSEGRKSANLIVGLLGGSCRLKKHISVNCTQTWITEHEDNLTKARESGY